LSPGFAKVFSLSLVTRSHDSHHRVLLPSLIQSLFTVSDQSYHQVSSSNHPPLLVTEYFPQGFSPHTIMKSCHQVLIASSCPESYIIICSVIPKSYLDSYHHACLITTSYHHVLSPRPITTSYHHILSPCLITTSYHHVLSPRPITTYYYHHVLSPRLITTSSHHVLSPRLITTSYHHVLSPPPWYNVVQHFANYKTVL
jgi:hypothetical protein